MTIYSQTKEVYKGLPYAFRCRVFGKYDKEFIETSPNRVNKSYTDLTDYDGFHYTTEMKYNANVKRWGNPTITDSCVVSGFSSSNYLELPTAFNPSDNNWEMKLKFKTATISSSSLQRIFHSCKGTGSSNRYGIVFSIDKGTFCFQISTNGSSWNNVYGTYSVQSNTTYWVKISFDGTNYKTSYSLDGNTYTDDISYSSTKLNYSLTKSYIGVFSSNGFVDVFTGSIDLSECEIKIESRYFPDAWTTAWTGATEQFKVYDFSQTILPWKWGYQNKLQVSKYCLSDTEQNKTYYSNQINGTITGTLTTNSSRAMSGFSSSNYLTVLSQWNPSNNPWKIHLRVTTGATDDTTKYIFGQPTKNYTTPQLDLVGKSLKLYLSSDMSSWDIAKGETCSIDLEPNTTYDVDVEFTGTSYTISVDGVIGLTVTTSTADYSGTYPLILGYDHGNAAFNGYIHLNESYIEFNGVEVWRGMNKETVPSMSYGKTIGTTNNVYVINGNESLSAEDSSQPLDTSATNPRYLGTI